MGRENLLVARRILLLTATLLSLAACAPSGSAPSAARPDASTTIAEPVLASMPAFYRDLPSTPSGPRGTVVAREAFTYPGASGAWRVAYTSVADDGAAIAVTGLVIVPAGAAPDGGWPVVSWAHGTTGIGDACAPSLDPTRMLPARSLLAAGFAFVATDYEGLGTLGRHPYLDGPSEARSILDITAAAQREPDWHLGPDVVIWGHSQGGHGALFAAEFAHEHPEMHVVGIVAGAPASGLDAVGAATTPALRRFSIMLASGLSDPVDLPLEDVLTEEGVEVVTQSSQWCSEAIQAAIDRLGSDARVARTDPSDAWRARLRQNDPLSIEWTSVIPTLIVHGSADDLLPVGNSASIHARRCARTGHSEFWTADGADHVTVVSATFPAMVRWMEERFSGVADSAVALPANVRRAVCS